MTRCRSDDWYASRSRELIAETADRTASSLAESSPMRAALTFSVVSWGVSSWPPTRSMTVWWSDREDVARAERDGVSASASDRIRSFRRLTSKMGLSEQLGRVDFLGVMLGVLVR
jgi:hypothetical protein